MTRAGDIRPAIPADAAAIAALWNTLIRDSLVTFTTVEKDAETIAQAIADGTPWWVAVVNNTVQGHATYSQFRGGPGYARSMEHSVHLHKQAQGLGLGRALMACVEAHAAAHGVHVMVAGVSSENPAGHAFHARLGYTDCGRVAQAGFKSGRYLDLLLMQKILT
jgi:L-amino acid N-acyltransferase